MGARRAGYFTGIIIMLIGLIMVPLGLVFMLGGIIEAFVIGSGDTFVEGLVLVIVGIILFVMGLVSSLILKKSGSENVNITINARDSMIGVAESNPMLKSDIEKLPNGEPIQKLPQEIGLDHKPLEKIDLQKVETKEEEEEVSQSDMVLDLQEAEKAEEEVSLQDMVLDLQEAEMGERARLDYITKRLADNRTIYNSDVEYVKKQFAKLRIKITKEDYSDSN